MSPPAGPHPQEEQPSTGQHNLPAPRTSFVGREREMVGVKRTLAMTRLLTLTGTGGSGKTRLAIEVARDLIGSYPDGVWLVELAPLSEGSLVAQQVANVLGVQEHPGQALVDTLAEALAGKEILLVLDNCEHLVEEAAHLADALLALCPRLRMLATSREPLGVEGEVLWQVPLLSLPAKADGAPNGEFTLDSLMRFEAVRLFVDRARLRLPDFELTRENAGSVARVPQAGEDNPRHRAGHGEDGGACGGAGGPEAGGLTRRAQGCEPYCFATTADLEGDTRLEPRPALGGRASDLRAAIRFRRRVDFGGGRSGMLWRQRRRRRCPGSPRRTGGRVASCGRGDYGRRGALRDAGTRPPVRAR
jgi:NB-ARC domain